MKSLEAFKIRPEIKAQENAIENKLVFECDWEDECVLHFNVNYCFHVFDFSYYYSYFKKLEIQRISASHVKQNKILSIYSNKIRYWMFS